MLAGIRAVAFDAVGTLLFPSRSVTEVYVETAAKHGFAVEASEVRTKLWERFRREDAADRAAGWMTSEVRERERWQNIVTACLPGATDELVDELLGRYARPDAWTTAPGMAELLACLAERGLKLALASNYDSRLSAVVAGKPELAPLRDRVVISSLVGARKPGGKFFEEVIGVLDCAPSEIAFVGDDVENDYDGATAAGMRAILIDAEGRHAGATNRIASLVQLLG